MPVPPSGHISPFTGTGTPQHASATASPRITPNHMPPPSIQVQPAVALDLLGVNTTAPPAPGSEAIDPRSAPISSVSAASGRSARDTGVPSNLAERVSERVDEVKKGPGGGPGSFGSGGSPGSGGSNAPRPEQPLRIKTTHVDPSS